MQTPLPAVLFAAALSAASLPALAQGLEPGEWQFDTTLTSPMIPKPQAGSFTRCIRKEDSENPEKWMGGQGKNESDCKVNTTKNTADTYSWTLSCKQSNMTGSGTARLGRGSMESEQKMNGEMQGQKFEMHVKTKARRLGACKG